MPSRQRLVAFLSVVVILVLFASSAPAQWLSGWSYRHEVTVANPCAADLSNHEVLIRLDASFAFAETEPGGADLRVTAADGETHLPYWIEDWEPAAQTATLRVRLPLLPVAGATIYLYYGNSAAASVADGATTFVAYDGFEGFGATNAGEWARHPGNPVLVEGPIGAWDDHGATFASVIRDDTAGEFRMYYHGFSGSVHQIGLATSPDGLNWTKYAGNPIVTPTAGAWDSGSVRVPMVWKEGTAYHMIYTGYGSGGFQVGYATSVDGIAWTKHAANPVFNDPTWATGETENWGVMKVGAEYLMWYSNFGVREVGIAVSTDLVNWAPHTPGPVFASSGDPQDDRYSMHTPSSFKFGDDYYVLMPSYSVDADYTKFYLYRSPSPYFPESNREYVRIAHTSGPNGEWDDHDADTPCILTLDVERTQFHNDELWCYYAGEGGSNFWKMGLHLETDIAAALTPVPEPEDSLQWTATGTVLPAAAPARHGDLSCRLVDEGVGGTQYLGTLPATTRGVAGAWLRRTSVSEGDTDIYLYGDNGASLACVGGLGRDGDFHCWNGGFIPTGVSWSVDTWYLVEMAFDSATDTYDFVVSDERCQEIARIEDIAYGNAAGDLDRLMLYTSSGYVGDAFADDVRLRAWCGTEPGASLGPVEIDPLSAVTDGPPRRICTLHQNRPNPFNPTTEIGFDLRRSGQVELAVYDLQGRRVATLLSGFRAAGPYQVRWNGRDEEGARLPSGAYYYRLRAAGDTDTRKMTLLK